MWKQVLAIILAYIPAGFVITSVLLVTLLKWVPVSSTPLMLIRCFQKIGNSQSKYEWTPIEDISDDMVKAVITAEDQNFMKHQGFDFEEIARMKHSWRSGDGPLRGCSTISQQTAKNCFTFCTHTWFRKVVEAYYTVLIERIWGKKRILEVYLNVAEMGPGIFGAEAAARHYYHIHASALTMADASSLACCLPNPLHRNPTWATIHLSKRRADIAFLAANY